MIKKKVNWIVPLTRTVVLYNKVDGVAMNLPLCHTLTNAFLVHFEKNWLQNCPSGFKPHYYRWYVGNMLVLLISSKHLEAFQNFLNGWHTNVSFAIESKKQSRKSFLDVKKDKRQNKTKHLPLLSTVNLSLVGFVHTLTPFYHLTTSLVLFTHSLINVCEFPQVGLNYTRN